VSVTEYREEQVGMLRDSLKEALAAAESLRTQLGMALDRAERAEAALRTLREEIADARQTPFGPSRD
jgi:hypothetical protein